MKLNNQLIKKVADDSGAVTVMFAFVFPALIVFYSLAMDGANFNSKRARLMDSINQSVLAIALTDNRNATVEDVNYNKAVMRRYISYYLGDRVVLSDNDLKIKVNAVKRAGNNAILDYVDYSAASSLVSIKTRILPYARNIGGSGFSPEVTVSADSNAGIIRKTMDVINKGTDFLFVIDFSSSMRGSRLNLVKKILDAFVKEALPVNDDNVKNTIGMVPYSIGTPVTVSSKNFRGGAQLGCSFAARLKSEYQVDYAYWYNKNMRNYPYANYKLAAYDADYYRHMFHQYIVGYSYTPILTLSAVRTRFCIKNGNSGRTVGRYSYSCETEPEIGIFDKASMHSKKFIDEYEGFAALINKANSHYNIVNVDTIDVEGTLAGDYLFNDGAVTTFTHLYATSTYRPFAYMCDAASSYTASKFSDPKGQPSFHVIELTQDVDELSKIQDMTMHGTGYTDSVNGLLRAVPVIAKGVNEKKVIIMLTDGEESGTTSSGPLALRNKLIGSKNGGMNLCSVIKKGLVDYSGGVTNSAEIYYLSLVNDSNRMRFWADNCVGTDKSIVASNYKDLMEVLLAIAQDGSLSYINKGD